MSEKKQDTDAAPEASCDVIMKGGITSGVVYPRAVAELAKTYRLHSIGGTSAGAIAAAAAAAAELGRYRGRSGFAELEKLPEWLGGRAAGRKNSNLFSMFQPQLNTRAVFESLAAGLEIQGGLMARALHVLLAAVRRFKLAAVLGGLAGIVLAGMLISSSHGALLIWGLVCALLIFVFGVIIAVAIAFSRRLFSSLAENGYGLCSGYSSPDTKGPMALTTWMAEYLDRLSANPDTSRPLTFGDLWGQQSEPGQSSEIPERDRLINLQMMTTNLTHGIPYRIPFKERIFYFKPEEFRKLFPAYVVDFMIDSARGGDDGEEQKYPGFVPLPEAADLPVVLGARLSLSFPLLISAVPLYAVDFSRQVAEQERLPERCWFSDGGITSNFPVHFFDAPLPRKPTFGVNLRGFHPDIPRDNANQCNNVWLPETNRQGVQAWWTRIHSESNPGKVLGFLGSVLDTMQSWADNSQLPVPGYRDRVVHVSLSDEEGGLNLNMPARRIEELGERGRCAGKRLVDRFTEDPDENEQPGWDNHRWIRFRSSMALVEEMLEKIVTAYTEDPVSERSYKELLMRERDSPPNSARWESVAQQEFARKMTEKIMRFAEELLADPESFRKNAPNPQPEFRISPKNR